jgi:hypothetical protein
VTHAPLSVIVVPVPVAAGDRGVWKKFQPDYRRHKALRKDSPWPVKQSIPGSDRNELRRRAQEWRDVNRSRAEAMLVEARMMLRAA